MLRAERGGGGMGGEEEGNFASRQRSKANGKSKNMGVTASKRPKYSHSVFVEWTRHGRESQWELTARIARPPASLYHGPPRKIWKVQGKHKYEGTGLVYIYIRTKYLETNETGEKEAVEETAETFRYRTSLAGHCTGKKGYYLGSSRESRRGRGKNRCP